VWQNLIIPNVADVDVEAVKAAIRIIGFDCEASFSSGALIACTGIKGCKFASADTKGHAQELIRFLKEKVELDEPVNIHLTGCAHSCAQHYIGDIGLIGTKVKVGEETVEGYHILVGGGVDNKQAIAREVFKSVAFYDIKSVVRQLLEGYKELRNPGENFWEFANRMSVEELRHLGEAVSA
jgi:ferredoxin-nitrite reductase